MRHWKIASFTLHLKNCLKEANMLHLALFASRLFVCYTAHANHVAVLRIFFASLARDRNPIESFANLFLTHPSNGLIHLFLFVTLDSLFDTPEYLPAMSQKGEK